jgi:hypothetical protein
MRYSYYLILFIICLLNAAPALAQDSRYRVELLVLTHLNYDQEPQELKYLEDYSQATDFLTPPEPEEQEEEEGISAEAEAPAPEEIIDVVEEPDPNALIHIEEMSDVMREAWRRLRLSGPFRPEQYLSWEQGSEAPFPALRVHDLEAIMVVDPYAEQRLELLEQEQAPVFADAAGLDALDEAEEPELPEPTAYYRLDGAVTLKRTRFLHLELDLQLREALWDEESPVPVEVMAPEYEKPPPSAFLVHALQQSRQVKTARMEYFDGPVLGVLAFITSIQVDSVDTP